MATKIIYFVRHGETELNAKKIRQGPEGTLTQKGKDQALAIAHRFPKDKWLPEIIISSPYERTRETSDIIARELNIEIEFSDLLKERRNPTEVLGHSYNEAEVKKITALIDGSFHSDDFRYSNEENFTDLKKRAAELLKYVSERKERRIIMVTHSIFLRMIMSYMIYGEELTASRYNSLGYSNPIGNASMNICSYITHWFKKNEWKVVMWNDLI